MAAKITSSRPAYSLADDGSFLIENFHLAPPFSSFLPGIAGVFGCPLWAFYVNRGQGIAAFGVEDKNGALMEFQPATKAYRQTELTGFRTFLKIDGAYYEPFRGHAAGVNREMRILPESLQIQEINRKLKIKIEVEYFVLPNENFPALVRTLKITNLGPKSRKLEVIDGMPMIVPVGFNDDLLKRIYRTTEAWCLVANAQKAPIFRLKVIPSDNPDTTLVEGGNFFLAFNGASGDKADSLKYITDPDVVFDGDDSLQTPGRFLEPKFSVPEKQNSEGFMPCAFSYQKTLLRKEFKLTSLFGKVRTDREALEIKSRASFSGYFEKKRAESRETIEKITGHINCETALPEFDSYARYSFMDNVMRGGLPVTLGGRTIYLFSRKHGDLERDYNDFKLTPAYFSAGNGNYRDVNQNRRSDLFFNPDLEAQNIHRFFNLVQLDGFNPLIMKPPKYQFGSMEKAERVLSKHLRTPKPGFAQRLTASFDLGEIVLEADRSGAWRTSRSEFAADVLSEAKAIEKANHGEGYWTDHFSYSLDLLESYESIYPDRIAEVLFKKDLTFYDNDHVVVPRKIKYVLAGGKLRQLKSVRIDQEKAQLIADRKSDKYLVRTENGEGQIYTSTLMAKILCIIANKAASFDAEGVGIEMEADKPDWYDALNGLPGLFGSSVSETLELKRLAQYALEKFKNSLSAEAVLLPSELFDFISESGTYLEKWEACYQLKEAFREKTRLGISGEEKPLSAETAIAYLEKVSAKCASGVKKMLAKYGTYCTYFINEAVDFENTNDGFRIKQFRQTPLPLFLEGFVHALKVEKDLRIYGNVKHSPLYDRKLGMYKVNASLEKMPLEIGRTRVFTPGWLENESVWLHMEYKYLLELLKTGLHQEFYEEMRTALIPFQPAERYKRSILENSSFIVSSANPREADHGRGFVARLSGASAEFIQMWITMFAGAKPFSIDGKGKLQFQFSPCLPKWLFKKAAVPFVAFTFLGVIDVVYLNKSGKSTFGEQAVKPVAYELTYTDGKMEKIEAAQLGESYAQTIRDRKVSKIQVTLA